MTISDSRSVDVDVRSAVDRELERLRSVSEEAGRDCAVLEAVNLCALHGVVMPAWLRVAFPQRYGLVTGAHVKSWDDAFGKYWPSRTRLGMARRLKTLLPTVHEAVWKELRINPARAIDDGLFEDAALRLGFYSTSQTRHYYYKAVKSGLTDLAIWKKQMVSGAVQAERPQKQISFRAR